MSTTALIVDPKAPPAFWNWSETLDLFGFRAWGPNLGLLTLAASLPDDWQIVYVDENVRPCTQQEWTQASIAFTGGMLPRQLAISEIISRAHQHGTQIVVGGADPSSQPGVYDDANIVVVGDVEDCGGFFDAALSSPRCGVLKPPHCDLTRSPTPRYDLIDPGHYLSIPTQWSRGCPHGCEFCYCCARDGRRLRAKSPLQIVDELQAIYDTGHRGWVDVVDDCLDAHPAWLRRVLCEVHAWSKSRRFPFRLSCQTSLRLGDHQGLLELMRRCGFHAAFVGIETPDPEALRTAGKRVNLTGDTVTRIRSIQAAGISTSAGFILGLDNEPADAGEQICDIAEEAGIAIAMVGLLAVLPQTPLAERLQREGRLYGSDLQRVGPDDTYQLLARLVAGNVPDQTSTGGLLFDTDGLDAFGRRFGRPRADILQEHVDCWDKLYAPRAFCERVWTQLRHLKVKPVHRYRFGQQLRQNVAVIKLWLRLRKIPGLRGPMWKLLGRALLYGGQPGIEYAITQLVAYLRFSGTRTLVKELLPKRLARERENGIGCRQLTTAN